jgi:TonB family protein
MSERAARRGRRARLSRRGILLASVVALAACLVAFAFLFRPRPRPAAAGQPESAPATVTVAEAEVKREPRADSATVAKVSRGARVEVRRDDGFWIEILTADASGYLPADALERDSERQARERRAGTILSFPPVSGVVAEDTDLRLSPFPMGARAGRLQKGTVVRVYSVDHAFYALRGPDGGLAFVDSAKVDVVPPDPAQPAIAPSKERALKNLEVMEVAEPLPEAPGEEAQPVEIPETPPTRRGPGAGPAAPAAAVPLEPATLATKVDPVYPEMARRAGIEGTVVLSATIGVDGRVTDVQVVRGLGFGLSEAAVSAVRRWQYRPAQGPEGPIVSRKEVRIEFRLRQ